MSVPKKSCDLPENFQVVYKNADEHLRGRFRAMKSWLKREKSLSEYEAISQAMIVFKESTSGESPTLHNSYDPSQEEIYEVISKLQCNAGLVNINDRVSTQTRLANEEDSSKLSTIKNSIAELSVRHNEEISSLRHSLEDLRKLRAEEKSSVQDMASLRRVFEESSKRSSDLHSSLSRKVERLELKIEQNSSVEDIAKLHKVFEESSKKVEDLHSSLSKRIDDLQSLQLKTEEKSSAEELVKKPGSIENVFSKINKFKLIQFCLYLVIVPVTAMTIEHAISNLEIFSGYIKPLSYLLAMITDYVAMLYLSRAKNPFKNDKCTVNAFMAVVIVMANLVGSYHLMKSQAAMKAKEEFSVELAKADASIAKMEKVKAKAENTYLLKKWSGQDPVKCEQNAADCKQYKTWRVENAHKKYLDAGSELAIAERTRNNILVKIEKGSTSSEMQTHFFYYLAVWILLFMAIVLDRTEEAEAKV